MRRVVIIPCVSMKRAKRMAAQNLYFGSYFKNCLEWGLSVVFPKDLFILSAKHGLLSLTTEIDPYNLRFGQAGCVSSKFVAEQANSLGLFEAEIYAIGGKEYLKVLRDAGLKFSAPVAGQQIGFAKQILKRNKGKFPDWKLA